MRILFAVATYWPALDGVANVTGYLAEGLAHKGHEVYILTSVRDNTDLLKSHEIHNNVDITRMHILVKWPLSIKALDEQSSREYYVKKVNELAPDVFVVVCSQTWTLDWIMHDIDGLQCKKVFYSHGYSAYKKSYGLLNCLVHINWYAFFTRLKAKSYYGKLYKIIKKFDLAFYLGEKDNSFLYAEKYGIENGCVLENGVDDIFFSQELLHKRKKRNMSFLYVANYSDNKNQRMLLDAYYKANIGESTLVFAGSNENDYLNELKRKSNDYYNEKKHVFFYVGLSRNEIFKLYKKADAFICPSKLESWSIVLHEAVACGLPIITTEVGACREINGCIIVNSVADMANEMQKLYCNDDYYRLMNERILNGRNQKSLSESSKVNEFEKKLSKLFES